MTGIILLFLMSVACSAFAPVNRIQENDLHSVLAPNAEDAVSENVSGLEFIRQADIIKYYLYTKRNPTSAQRLEIDNANSITESYFNANNPTVVLVHGWKDNITSIFNHVIKEAYLQKSDVNLITVDWNAVANGLYTTSVWRVPGTGRALGQFLSFLTTTTRASFADMHLIGFSLGAHVVGNAGRALGGKVARITGLDPAGPLWYINPNRLQSSDAVYVEAIHTGSSIVGLGIAMAVADADFFPNGGSSQPGCSDLFCNHNRAYELFAATVTYNNIVANRCADMKQVAKNSCRGDELYMGNDDLNKRGSGLYRGDTKAEYPF